MRRIFLLIALSALAAGTAGAKSRRVNLMAELKQARVIAPVMVISYNDDGLMVSLKGNPKDWRVIRYAADRKWNPGPFIKKELTGMETGEWPPNGSEILVVTDRRNVISLFAYPVRHEWRFWSPALTGDPALFVCDPPSEVLSRARTESAKLASNQSEHGCWLPDEKVKGLFKW